MKWEKFSGWLALFIMGIGMLFCLQILQGKWGEWGVVPADPGGIQGGERGSAGHRGVGENMDGTVGGFSERNGTGQRI